MAARDSTPSGAVTAEQFPWHDGAYPHRDLRRALLAETPGPPPAPPLGAPETAAPPPMPVRPAPSFKGPPESSRWVDQVPRPPPGAKLTYLQDLPPAAVPPDMGETHSQCGAEEPPVARGSAPWPRWDEVDPGPEGPSCTVRVQAPTPASGAWGGGPAATSSATTGAPAVAPLSHYGSASTSTPGDPAGSASTPLSQKEAALIDNNVKLSRQHADATFLARLATPNALADQTVEILWDGSVMRVPCSSAVISMSELVMLSLSP